MAATTHDLEPSGSFEPPRVQVGPVRLHHMLLDGSWWPRSTDLDTELRDLVPVLDHVRGPVARLLLGVATWTARPHQVVTAGRAVSVGYLAGQSPSMMTVLCADGGTFTMRVAPPGPGAPDTTATGRGNETGEAERSGPGTPQTGRCDDTGGSVR
jgi:hypothetical protein